MYPLHQQNHKVGCYEKGRTIKETKMTVAELVEKLKSCNQDKDVLVEGRSELKDIACVSSTHNLGTQEEYIAIQVEE